MSYVRIRNHQTVIFDCKISLKGLKTHFSLLLAVVFIHLDYFCVSCRDLEISVIESLPSLKHNGTRKHSAFGALSATLVLSDIMTGLLKIIHRPCSNSFVYNVLFSTLPNRIAALGEACMYCQLTENSSAELAYSTAQPRWSNYVSFCAVIGCSSAEKKRLLNESAYNKVCRSSIDTRASQVQTPVQIRSRWQVNPDHAHTFF